MSAPAFSVVVPTVGRPSLRLLLDALAGGTGPAPAAVVVVDDRRRVDRPLDVPVWDRLQVVPGPARGPAAARNVGWLATETSWVAFLDDDVLPPASWSADLVADLAGLPPSVAGSQGRLRVPLPADRRPTDWERVTAGLAGAAWATADMAFRRSALVRVGGFDERFPRAYREDADLALRLLDAGFELVRGERGVEHPVRPASRWVSVRTQAGNADDALLRRLHGRGWRARAGAGRGRLPRHAAVTAAGVASLVGVLTRRRTLALAGALGWLAGTAEFARARIAPGPRTAAEVATMAVTSAVIPPVAVAHRLRGELAARRAAPMSPPRYAVLFDRDGTLVRDVPYNGDPELVEPVPGALAVLTALRAGGVPLGVVTNQSGIGRGTVTRDQVDAVNARVEELLGPFDTWQLCPHAPADGCECRKPRPGLVLAAAAALGVPAERCVVIGDIGADVAAATAAGARAVLVPTPVTRPEEVRAAPVVAPDLRTAVAVGLDMVGAAMSRVLVARLDNDGDVLLAGPAVRAVAAAAPVLLLVGPRGRQAAALLPGVERTLVWRAPWIDPSPAPVSPSDVDGLVAALRAAELDAAVVLTSFHQSALPLALLLRLAGVPRITAVSEDYPGSLLDVRHRLAGDVPEAERGLSTAAAAGYVLPPGDDGRLRVRRPLPEVGHLTGPKPYVVLHPGASAPARAWSPQRCAAAVEALAAAGHRVLVTGGPAETGLTRRVAAGQDLSGQNLSGQNLSGQDLSGQVVDLGGRTSFAELAAVLAGASAVVVGNTGPAHLAAAVGTPVVSLFAPVVPAARWAPYGVPSVLLGDQHAPCAATRATVCPVPGHPCLDSVTAEDVVLAVEKLTAADELVTA